MNYHKQLYNHILNRMTDETTAAENPYKSVNIALVSVRVFLAWCDLNPRIICKCFARCGFQFPGAADDYSELIVAEMDENYSRVIVIVNDITL